MVLVSCSLLATGCAQFAWGAAASRTRETDEWPTRDSRATRALLLEPLYTPHRIASARPASGRTSVREEECWRCQPSASRAVQPALELATHASSVQALGQILVLVSSHPLLTPAATPLSFDPLAVGTALHACAPLVLAPLSVALSVALLLPSTWPRFQFQFRLSCGRPSPRPRVTARCASACSRW